MDPFIRAEIEELRNSEDKHDRTQAIVLEVLAVHGERLLRIEQKQEDAGKTQDATFTQTKLTNGRMNRAEDDLATLKARVLELEKPVVIPVGQIWKSGKSFTMALVAIAASVAGVVSTIAPKQPDPNAIKAAVAAAIAESKKPTP